MSSDCKKLGRQLKKGGFGLEKENIRIRKDGGISTSAHPEVFGNKLNHPYITTDFAENQMEMITPVVNKVEDLYDSILNIHKVVQKELEDEMLWTSSAPPMVMDEDQIQVSQYDETEAGKQAFAYREYLAERYGKLRQLFSGLHYNYSLPKELPDVLKKDLQGTDVEIRNQLYLKLAKNFSKHRWLLVYLLGASPKVADEELNNKYPYAISFRNSNMGYCNEEAIDLDYTDIKAYTNGVRQHLQSNHIGYLKELYSPIRLKAYPYTLDTLENDGIAYIEMRILDLNPMELVGINRWDLIFVHMFMMYVLLMEDCEFGASEQLQADEYVNTVALYGRDASTTFTLEGKQRKVKEIAEELLQHIESLSLELYGEGEYTQAVKKQLDKINDLDLLPSSIISNGVMNSSYNAYFVDQARIVRDEALKKSYNLQGYEDLELSTQILLKGAIKHGIEYDVLDRKDNFVMLKKKDRVEYVKQASKTSLDSYTTFLIMENKLMSKYVLEKHGVKVPTGEVYTEVEQAMDAYEQFQGKAIVIKPKSTNFGIGISIIKELKAKEDFKEAVELAFRHDSSILVEEFIKGKEYRCLVIGDKVVGILHRVPANVTGDGVHTIEELVKEKNKDPLRSKGYKTPLEFLRCGQEEEMFLRLQELSFDSVPQEGEQVFLRENSNISTGGDSIDFTDDILDSYKDIAVKAAKAAEASICGVDLMIEDIKAEPTDHNHGIIEINFNPAIHIHGYPYKGENRHAEDEILNLLFPRS